MMDKLPSTVPWEKDQDKYTMGVFGKKTLMDLYFLSNKGIVRQLYGEISRGKEASIFAAKTKEDRWVAVKVFKQNPSYDYTKYIHGDPRFEYFRKNSLMDTWTNKEFKNLSFFHKLGVRVPEPIVARGCVLVMEFIGEGPLPAPTLKEQPPEEPKKYFKIILDYMKKSYRGGLVHGDLSEYNIMDRNGPVLIDCSQSVISKHPQYLSFWERDIRNVVRFFSKLGVDCSEETVKEKVMVK